MYPRMRMSKRFYSNTWDACHPNLTYVLAQKPPRRSKMNFPPMVIVAGPNNQNSQPISYMIVKIYVSDCTSISSQRWSHLQSLFDLSCNSMAFLQTLFFVGIPLSWFCHANDNRILSFCNASMHLHTKGCIYLTNCQNILFRVSHKLLVIGLL